MLCCPYCSRSASRVGTIYRYLELAQLVLQVLISPVRVQPVLLGLVEFDGQCCHRGFQVILVVRPGLSCQSVWIETRNFPSHGKSIKQNILLQTRRSASWGIRRPSAAPLWPSPGTRRTSSRWGHSGTCSFSPSSDREKKCWRYAFTNDGWKSLTSSFLSCSRS